MREPIAAPARAPYRVNTGAYVGAPTVHARMRQGSKPTCGRRDPGVVSACVLYGLTTAKRPHECGRRGPASGPIGFQPGTLADCGPHRQGNLLQIGDKRGELVEVERLRAIAQGLARVGMHFDHDAVRPNRHCGA